MIRAAVLRACGEPPSVERRPPPTPGEGDLTVAVTEAWTRQASGAADRRIVLTF